MTAPHATREAGSDLFGGLHLGYVVVESRRFTDWRRFGADAIGLHVDELERDVLRFRLDDHDCRVLVVRGPAEDVVAAGWQADSHEILDTVLARVRAAGLPVTEGDERACALRGVERLWHFPGPNGMAVEVVTRALRTDAPLRMLQSGFVTGGSGMGHLALTARQPAAVRAYFQQLFDARLSDRIVERIAGVPMTIRFLRVDERHHSVAVAGLPAPVDPVRTAVQHLNTEVATLDDLLAARGRVVDHGFRLQWDVGQHTNDRELSFYCVTPSGFEWELGWAPVVVTPEAEEHWQPSTYEGISIWGHSEAGHRVVSTLERMAGVARSVGPAGRGLDTPWGRI